MSNTVIINSNKKKTMVLTREEFRTRLSEALERVNDLNETISHYASLKEEPGKSISSKKILITNTSIVKASKNNEAGFKVHSIDKLEMLLDKMFND